MSVVYQLVTREPGANWDHSVGMRQQERWDEHAAFMDALATEGFIVMGGPLGDGERFVFATSARDGDEARARFAADPWEPMGLLTITSIEPWEVLLRS